MKGKKVFLLMVLGVLLWGVARRRENCRWE
jgi:hypothetical protein